MSIPEYLQVLYNLYPKILFEYRRVNQAEHDGVITPDEAMLIRRSGYKTK